jgi:4-amino-4-deoxy-L-arabinose transferase-like glycosyltransferase
MIASSSASEPLRSGVRRLLKNEWFVAVAILITAMAMRWGFHLYNPDANGFFIYHGSPISDGSSYTYKAINIAKGYGIPPSQQPAIRPFYSIVLACLYTWTGFSLTAVTALNIVIGGIAAALIYLCGVLAFNRLCGLAAALFFAIDPTQLVQTPQACTEPLGLLFFVGSVYTAMLAFQSRGPWMFFLSGLLIGLSNLTRTLTMFTLPFYIAVVLLLGWREWRLGPASLHALLMVLGFFCVVLPWLIRQERLYGIASLSDNIGEAIYAATSPVHQQWTPGVRKDADAAGVPNRIGDRYRYFIDHAVDNVKNDTGFYLRNVGAAFWEYANTFGPRSRALNRYANSHSSAAQSQSLLFVYLVGFTLTVWLLSKDRLLAASNSVFLLTSIGLLVFYWILPGWATFFPVLVGIICSWRGGHRLPVLILLGSLTATVFGSAIFANPVLFRAILMTDWLFLFYLLVAIWFPAKSLSRRFATEGEPGWAAGAEEDRKSAFLQKTLSLFSRRSLLFLLMVLLGFFAVSGVRLVGLTLSQRGEKPKTQLSPGWTLNIDLPATEQMSILRRLQHSPFSVLPENPQQFPLYTDGKDLPKPGDYIVAIQGFYYDYYIPARELPRPPTLGPKPYTRTLVIGPRFDFIIAGEIPSDFAARPLIFVGVVFPKDVTTKQQAERPQVQGLAIIPLSDRGRPDFAHAISAPPAYQFSY